MQPTSPAAQRLRTLRRRILAGVIAAFVAAWLAVAALGKGGTSHAATSAPASSGSSSAPQSQSDDGTSSGQFDDGGSSSQPDDGGMSSQPGPATTSQS